MKKAPEKGGIIVPGSRLRAIISCPSWGFAGSHVSVREPESETVKTVNCFGTLMKDA